MTVYVASALVSQWTNYVFASRGATGIIVAIGVTVDSYVDVFRATEGRGPRRSLPPQCRAAVSS